jgi:hypothetical protein
MFDNLGRRQLLKRAGLTLIGAGDSRPLSF